MQINFRKTRISISSAPGYKTAKSIFDAAAMLIEAQWVRTAQYPGMATHIQGDRMRFLLLVSFVLSSVCAAIASDHVDGEVTKTRPLSDLSDLYAFPSDDGKSLTIALTTHPFARGGAQFSADVGYVLVIRNANLQGDGEQSLPALSGEVRIVCTFAGGDTDSQTMICAGPDDLKVTSKTGETGTGDGFRQYAGLRSDPFFFDATWSLKVSKEGKVDDPTGDNTMKSLNALAIVLELERSKIFGGDFGVLAIAAEAFQAKGGGRRLDRLGRPEITNVGLVSREGDPDLRDDYNVEPVSGPPGDKAGAYLKQLSTNILFHDKLDGQADWTAADADRFAKLLLQDYLLVDPSKPCKADEFLEIERAWMAGKAHETCGGRKFADDVMDTLYTTLINKGNRAFAGDGVNEADKKTSNEFPYLAEPETGFLSSLKARIAAWLAGQ